MSFVVRDPLTLCPECGAQPHQKCFAVDEAGFRFELLLVHKARARPEQKAVYGKTIVMTADMQDDFHPLDKGDIGRVELMDDTGTLHAKWRGGRRLGVLPVDEYRIVECCDEAVPHEAMADVPKRGTHWVRGVTKSIQVSETREEEE